MSKNIKNLRSTNEPKRKWFAIAGLCVVICKLPLILALIGIGSIGASTSQFGKTLTSNQTAIIIGLSLILIAAAYYIYRVHQRSKS